MEPNHVSDLQTRIEITILVQFFQGNKIRREETTYVCSIYSLLVYVSMIFVVDSWQKIKYPQRMKTDPYFHVSNEQIPRSFKNFRISTENSIKISNLIRIMCECSSFCDCIFNEPHNTQ